MWTDDLALAAGALELAAGYYRRAEEDADAYGPRAEQVVWLEQAEGEVERATRFAERARQAVRHAA